MNRFLTLLVLAAALCPTHAADLFFDFASSNALTGFHSTVTGEGKPGLWRIITDEVPSTIPTITANAPATKKSVLAQLSRDLTDEHYPILVYTNDTFGDFTFTTRLKCVSGVVEQMAGIVFRYQDEKNYYYVRASAKGSTFRFFKLVDGQRSAPIGPEMQIPAGTWHDLSVECKANKIRILFNGQPIIPELTDNSFASGKIGFWTKSDSVSHFADARITYTPREPFIKSVLRDIQQKYPRVQSLRIYGKTPENHLRVMAATDDSQLGQPGTDVEQKIFEMDLPFYGKIKTGIVVTLPVHDRNGDVIAALRVEMKSFPGQTESNALARATPIAKDIEFRIVDVKELF
ncbi:MAG TPA: family 16 glycoside hydrolase [Verrucomicrobiae bacterium]